MAVDFDTLLDGFPRTVPVFPLPEVILFPNAVLPLHIFEPRYRAMLDDAIAGDGVIAMALLKECDKTQYQEAPPFFSTVCLGRVVHHQKLPDGRSNIALLGLSAARVVPEPDAGEAPVYPSARVALLEDTFARAADHDEKLARAIESSVPGGDGLSGLEAQLGEFLAPERIPVALVNTCALTAPLRPQNKYELLEERRVERRLDRLLELLARHWQWN